MDFINLEKELMTKSMKVSIVSPNFDSVTQESNIVATAKSKAKPKLNGLAASQSLKALKKIVRTKSPIKSSASSTKHQSLKSIDLKSTPSKVHIQDCRGSLA